MAYLALLWKARTIEKYRLNYEREKLNSIRLSNTQIEKKSVFQRLWQYNAVIKKQTCKTFKRWYPEGSSVNNLLVYLKTDQTFPKFLLKSVVGFIGGLLLTYLCFMFFVFQLSISLMYATVMSSFIGVLLTLGLTFSYRIRCLVFLLIPQLFSRVGRYTLTCYALVLILTGPATNTLKNSEVLTECLACGQEQIKTSVHQINESMKNPLNAVKDNIVMILKQARLISDEMNEMMATIRRLVMSTANILQFSFTWLKSIVRTCNKNLGTPYERCQKVLSDAALDCYAKFGAKYAKLCSAGNITDAVCSSAKSSKRFCSPIVHVNDNIENIVRKKFQIFSSRIKKMLYLDIHVHHSYSFSSNSSHSASQIAAGIVTEIRKRADPLLTYLSWSSCVTSLFLLLIIFRAKHYQHMFETRSRFDNRYITKELRELDLKRLRQGRETVLPLNRREKTKYIKTTSFRLVSSEKVHMARSVIFMLITTFKLMIHMVADYSLYWMLMNIRHHGRLQSPLRPGVPDPGAQITGSGPVARLLRSIISSMSLSLAVPGPSPAACLPVPHPPDLQRYTQIGMLIILLWFFSLFEPYGLRLRHVIMSLYRPERSKARALWLFNHIQHTRAGFMKYARRKLHREYKYSTEMKNTFREWLQFYINCRCLQYFLGITPRDPHCLLCGTTQLANDVNTSLIMCETPKCPGTFCACCFLDIGQLCTICMSPADYGDLSDVSLEKGSSAESSDDENNPLCQDPEDDPKTQESTKLLKRHEADKNNTDSNKGQPHDTKKWTFCRKKNNDVEMEEQAFLMTTIEELENHITNLNTEVFSKRANMIRHLKHSSNYQENKNCALNGRIREENGIVVENYFYCQFCRFYYNNVTNPKTFDSINKKIIGVNSVETKEFFKKSSNNVSSGIHLKKFRKYKKQNINDVKLIKSSLDHLRKLRKYSLKRNKSLNKIWTNHNWYLISIPGLQNRNVNLKRNKKIKNDSTKIFKGNIPTKATKNSSTLKSLSNLPKNAKKFQGLKLTCRKRRTSRIGIIGKSYLRAKSHDAFRNTLKCKGNSNYNDQSEKSNQESIMLHCVDEGNRPIKHIRVRFDNETEEPDNDIKNERTPDDSQSYCYCLGKFRNICTVYWHYAKQNFAFNTSAKILNYFRKSDVELYYKKANHKRRNKHEAASVKTYVTKKDNEDTRKYRISTYLSDQDWVKRSCNKNMGVNPNFVLQDDIKESLTELKAKAGLRKLKEAELLESIMTKKRENALKYTNIGKIDDLSDQDIAQEENVGCRLRKKLNSNFKPSSSTVSYAAQLMKKIDSMQENILDETFDCGSFNYHKSGSLNFYRTLGHRDFDSDVDIFIDDVFKDHKEDANKIFEKVKPKINPDRDDMELAVASITSLCSRRDNVSPPDRNNKTLEQIPERDKETKPNKAKNTTYYGYWNPISFIKSIFLCNFGIFKRSNKRSAKGLKDDIELAQRYDRDPSIFPVRSCTNPPLNETRAVQERPAKILMMKNVALSVSRQNFQDAEVEAQATTCNCATQYIGLSKDVCTFFNKKIKKPASKDATTLHYNAPKPISCRNMGTLHPNCITSPPVLIRFGDSSTEAIRRASSGDSKTDTTICSLATVDYIDEMPKLRKSKKPKVNVVTKANQATITDRKFVCDASTVTSDWWSPIVERKNIKLEKKRGGYIMPDRKMKMKKHIGVSAEGRAVKFQSHAQIIPTGNDDILSPSRYLLESQRYYNELFSPRLYTSHMAVSSVQLQRNFNEKRSPRHVREYKPKRLNECYSPRKMKLNFEYKWIPESKNRQSQLHKNQNRNRRKVFADPLLQSRM